MGLTAALLLIGCGKSSDKVGRLPVTSGGRAVPAEQTVVCYTSTDQVFAEPILKEFEQKTGIKVKAKYDTEETKTTGLVNLIQAEKNNPQADVFWSSETGRAIALKATGCLASYKSPNVEGIPARFKDPAGYWTGFAARARVILYNTNLVKSNPPSSVLDLLQPQWKGQAAIANPLFGTTSFHATALFLHWGDEKAREFFRKAKENGVQILPSNGAVKDAISDGRVAWGFLDTDDANVAVKDGKPINVVYPDQKQSAIRNPQSAIGTPVMPNTVSLIAGAPHPETARKLIDYLLSAETEKRLAEMDCVQMPLHPDVPTPPNVKPVGAIKAMDVDYAKVADQIKEVDKTLKELLGL
jgi:iron(III) transport system substrate-binding protein